MHCIHFIGTRRSERISVQYGFNKSARVVVGRNFTLDRLALCESPKLPERRLTVSFANADEFFDLQNHQATSSSGAPRNESLDQSVRSILKKNPKHAPFHIRGRRKSTSTLEISNRDPSAKFRNTQKVHQIDVSLPTSSNALTKIAISYGSDSDD